MSKKKSPANEVSDDSLSLREKIQEVVEVVEGVVESHFPKLAFTLDEVTVSMLDELRTPTHISRGAIARVIIREVMDAPEQFAVSKFYEDVWQRVYFRAEQLKRVVQLILPRELNVYLVKTSEQILDEQNRSEIFRLLVALYATKKRVVELITTEVFEFKINYARSSVKRGS